MIFKSKSNTKYIKNLPTSIKILSIVLAIFIDVKALNASFSSGLSTDGQEGLGLMSLMYFGCTIVVILASIFSRKIIKNISSQAVIIIFYLFFLCGFTQLFLEGIPYTRFTMFIALTIIPFVMPFITSIDTRLFMKSVMGISCVGIFNIQNIFFQSMIRENTISMGLSYAFLTSVLVCIIYMYTYFREESRSQKFLTILFMVINVVYAIFLISYGSRGPVIAMIVTIFIPLVVGYDKRNEQIVIKFWKLFVFAISILLAILIFDSLIIQIHKMLLHHGIELNFIEKFIYLHQQGDISNGRELVYESSINEIFNSPIWGHGFDLFSQYVRDVPYPHNFIIQILFDGGIVFTLLLFIPVIKDIRNKFKKCTYDEYVMLITLGVASIMTSMFSGDLWQASLLWMFFGYSISSHFVYNPVYQK